MTGSERSSCAATAASVATAAALLLCVSWPCRGDGQVAAVARSGDSRIRTVVYGPGLVYRLRGYVGYQIDLEFEPGEVFMGLGAGDVEGLAFTARDNHLFLKPRAARLRTNLTVLTNRRSYHFDYEVVSSAGPGRTDPELIYVLSFAYPAPVAAPPEPSHGSVDGEFERAAAAQPLNRDYWYCGSEALLPLAAFDDGVQMHLRFNPRGELPAIFVRNDDGSESLLNFSAHEGEIVIHRLARQFVVRRGKLTGCIVNKSFGGTGRELQSGTVSSGVERATRGGAP